MNYINFSEILPKIAEKETRSLTILRDPNIPDGDYLLSDGHCGDKTCDCRRLFINVMQITDEKLIHLTTISYGWEAVAFYRKWSKWLTDEQIEIFKGPALDPYQQQSPISPYFLEIFKRMVAEDPTYIARLKKHYKLFKWKTGMTLPKDMPFDPSMPCPCKSGNKFRFCCGRK